VLLGGLLAGVIIDASEALINGVSKQDSGDLMTKLGKSPDRTALAAFNVIGFVTAIWMVWLYAAIRSRYGAGQGPPLLVAVTIWVIGYAVPAIGQAGLGLLPAQLVETATGLGRIEVILAALAVASVYKEEAGQTLAAISAGAR